MDKTTTFLIGAVCLAIVSLLPKASCECIQNSSLIIQLEENAQPNTQLRQVSTPEVPFTIQGMEALPGLLVAKDGWITVNETIDVDGRPELCSFLKQGSTTLQVTCQGETSSTLILTTIWTDDFPPRFSNAFYDVNITERNAIGAALFSFKQNGIEAADDDCITQNTFYGLGENPSQGFPFRLSTDRMSVVVEESLDYEVVQQYSINISVESSQAGDEYKFDYATVRVRVIDINDMPPVFDQTDFELDLEEGRDFSSNWLSTTPPVTARDGDTGLQDQQYNVQYSILDVFPALDVVIHPSHGSVKINQVLDREVADMYTVVIKVMEADTPLHSATATIKVKVIDVNDNRPVFTPVSRNVTLWEDASSSYKVTLVSAHDADSNEDKMTPNPNGEFSYELQSDPLGAFGLSHDDVSQQTWLVVSNTSALSGQLSGVVKVKAVEKQATAEGSPECDYVTTCIFTVFVTVEDVNDHPPVFQQTRYDFVISAHGHTNIGQLVASDKDRDGNGLLEYSLETISPSLECDKVLVNATTGEMRVTHAMVPGTGCSFLARACDTPQDMRQRRCTAVPVALTVIENVSPTNVLEYDVSILENMPQLTYVMVVPFPTLISNVSEFIVTDSTLKTSKELDRESQDLYHVGLFAGSADSRLALIVHVTVEDTNDNSPAFEQRQYDVVLPEEAKKDDVITRLRATDSDADDNAKLVYELLGESSYVKLQPETGDLLLLQHPSSSDGTVTSLEIPVRAKDSGDPPRQDVTVVKLMWSHNTSTSELVLAASPEQLNALGKLEVARILSEILGVVTVSVVDVETFSPVSSIGSRVTVTGVWSANQGGYTAGERVHTEHLDSLLADNGQAIHRAFESATGRPSRSVGDNDDEDLWTVAFIAALSAAIFFLLLLVVCACLLHRSHKKNKHNASIISKLTKDTSIYSSLKTHNATKPRGSKSNTANGSTTSNGSYTMGGSGRAPVDTTFNATPIVLTTPSGPSADREMTYFDNPAYINDDTEPRGEPVGAGNWDIHDVTDSRPLQELEDSNERFTSFGVLDSHLTMDNTGAEPVFTSVIHVGEDATGPGDKDNGSATSNDIPAGRPVSRVSVDEGNASPGSRSASSALSQHLAQRRNSVKSSSEVDSGIHADTGYFLGPETIEAPHAMKGAVGPVQTGENLDIMTTRVFPPPMVCPPSSTEGSVDIPEEPEPDYAKKVRFNETRGTEIDTQEVEGKDHTAQQNFVDPSETLAEQTQFSFHDTEITAL